MKTMFRVILMGVLGAVPAFAVIGGTQTPVSSVSTLELKIRHKLWSGRDGGYIFVWGTCSSVIVGLKPFTLLTASHCFRDVDMDEKTKLPRLELNDLANEASLRLVKATYTPIEIVNQHGATDLAVLVFEGEGDSRWKPRPIAMGVQPREVLICGFGYSAKEGPSVQPKCASKETVKDLMDFSSFVPPSYRASDAGLYLQYETQFLSKAERFSSMADLMGVSRLHEGEYSVETPIPREGDSGGPWFAKNDQGELAIVALTSFGETFFRKNRVWPAFRDPAIPSDDLTYAMYGVRLDTSEARAFLQSARAAGADISF